MKSLTTSDFWKAYADLSPEKQEKARRAYQLWQSDPMHPSLHFKKVGKNLWSVRLSGGYRALALKKALLHKKESVLCNERVPIEHQTQRQQAETAIPRPQLE
jgi:hypothetical protein